MQRSAAVAISLVHAAVVLVQQVGHVEHALAASQAVQRRGAIARGCISVRSCDAGEIWTTVIVSFSGQLKIKKKKRTEEEEEEEEENKELKKTKHGYRCLMGASRSFLSLSFSFLFFLMHCTSVEEDAADIGVAECRGVMQRVPARVRGNIDLRAGGQQCTHNVGPTHGAGKVQRDLRL